MVCPLQVIIKIVIVTTPKLIHHSCFANLSRTPEEQRLSSWTLLPHFQLVLYVSIKHLYIDLKMQRYKNVLKRQILCTKNVLKRQILCAKNVSKRQISLPHYLGHQFLFTLVKLLQVGEDIFALAWCNILVELAGEWHLVAYLDFLGVYLGFRQVGVDIALPLPVRVNGRGSQGELDRNQGEPRDKCTGSAGIVS